MEIKQMIYELCNTMGVSGSEEPIVSVAKRYLDNISKTYIDNNGNLYAVLGNENADKTIILDAHMDRIGFIVTDIDENGFVKVDKCGGIDARTLLDSKLVLQRNPEIEGVVCCMPPHLSDGKEDKAVSFDKLWVDFGMPYREIKKHIEFGDVLTFKPSVTDLLNNRISSPALDNRCSVAALIKCAEYLSRVGNLKYKVVILLSVQEETFGTGAKTGAFSIDADESIVVDVSFASQPDISGQYSKIELDKGPMVCISPILNKEMSRKMIVLAEEYDIPYQIEPISGVTGTNADSISVSRQGVKTSVISIPQRYMHTPCEVISIADVENTAKLIYQYVINGGAYND